MAYSERIMLRVTPEMKLAVSEHGNVQRFIRDAVGAALSGGVVEKSGVSKNFAQKFEPPIEDLPVERPWLDEMEVQSERGRLTMAEIEARGGSAGSSVRQKYFSELPGRERVFLDYLDEKGEVHRNTAIKDMGWGEHFYSLLEHDLIVRGVVRNDLGQISLR